MNSQENISDKTYNVRIGVFYKDGDDYYLIKYHNVKELEGSDELDLIPMWYKVQKEITSQLLNSI